MRHVQIVGYAVVSLCASVLIGCGGGGGGATTASPASSAAPPGGGAAVATVPVPPSLAGPSVLAGGTPGKFEGATLPPGTAVTIVIRQPDGIETSHHAMVDGAGRISHDVTSGGGGLHSVRVLDSSGRELATANFIGL